MAAGILRFIVTAGYPASDAGYIIHGINPIAPQTFGQPAPEER
jgi:hypothetical protein